MVFDRIMEKHFMNIGSNLKDYVHAAHIKISDQLLIQYLYEGLLSMDRSMIYATSRDA